MNAIGTLPNNISFLDAIDSIGENIIIANKDYNILWMNSTAVILLKKVAPLFGFNDAKDLIGVNMDRFHHNPQYQKKVMEKITDSHRARITIQEQFVTDIVITPIKGKNKELQGYVVILMDVSTKAEEEKEREELISSLSVPIITVWENTIALPLIGRFDKERADKMLSSVLHECVTNGIRYVLVDLSGLYEFEYETKSELQKLCDCLKLIGAKCILVGVSPKLAMAVGEISHDILTFNNAYTGLKYIINTEQKVGI